VGLTNNDRYVASAWRAPVELGLWEDYWLLGRQAAACTIGSSTSSDLAGRGLPARKPPALTGSVKE